MYDPDEAFGGPIHYVIKRGERGTSGTSNFVNAIPNANKAQPNPAGSPTRLDANFNPTGDHAFRFKVDLSELYTLSTNYGGILPFDYRVGSAQTSLLSLISQICSVASADFFVELLPDVAPGGNNKFLGVSNDASMDHNIYKIFS